MGEESARIMHLERKRTARGSAEFNQSTVMSCCSEETESTCSTTDEDKDQELEYGPGIVNKLRTRFLSITLKQSNGPRSNMRRSCSLENLLDKDRPFQENVFLVQERWMSGDGGLKSRNVSCWSKMKRAKSMDTLLLEAAAAEQNEVHLEQDCESPLDAAKIEVASADVAADGKLLHEPKVIKRRDGGLCRSTVAICDEELPKPDTVKTYKRIFEPVEAKLVAHSNVRRRPPVLRASAKATTAKPGIIAKSNGSMGFAQSKRNGSPAKSRFSAKESSKAGGDDVCHDPNPPEDGNNRLNSVAEDAKISRLAKENAFVGRLGKDDNEKNDVKKNEAVMQYNLRNAKFSEKSMNCITTGKAINIKECKKKLSLITDFNGEEDAGVENGVRSNGENEISKTCASNKNESDAKETNCELGDEDGDCRSSELLKNQANEEKPVQNGFCSPKCDEKNGTEGENGTDSPSNHRPQHSEEKAQQWQKPTPSSNTIVFDFRGKDVTPHLSLLPTPFGCKAAAVQPRKRALLMDGKEMAPFANGLVNGNSSHGDSDDEDYESGDNLPHPSGVLFEGENVRVGRGAILTTRNKRLKIQFDDAIIDTFEYPSEASLLLEESKSGSTQELTNPDLSSVDSPPLVPPPRLQANTPIAFSGGLAAYTPRVLQAVDTFEPGMFRPLQKETAEEEASAISSSQEENGATEEEEMLKPADPEDSSVWSDATNTSDLLF